MTYNASNRKHIRDAEKRAASESQTIIDFVCAAMTTTAGRTFFYRLIAETSPFADAPTFETLKDYFTSGRRSVGLQHMAIILTHCPDQYTTMMQEANARDLAAAQRTRSPEPGRDDLGPDPSDLGDPTDGPDAAPDLFDPYGTDP